MTFEENIRAILCCNFPDIKDEILESVAQRICSVSNLTTIDDCISRKALKEFIYQYYDIDKVKGILNFIDNAPTVEPKRSQGTWIRKEDPRYSYDRENGHIMAGVSFHCSECDGMGDSSDVFCKHCGTSMKLPGNKI